MKLINIDFKYSNPHLFEESTLCSAFHGEQITAPVCGKAGLNQFVVSTLFTVILLHI